ncbi:MAG: hypothetical protein JXL80_12975 [Planctomycetes bacterium]|nr:hypothetical protein [Planctomycetota bacterium]
MKTSRLAAVVVAVATVALFASNASAMYNPSLGCWMQRDPGPGGPVATTPRVGGGPVAGGAFLPRDPAGNGQYADGMNLYQYGRSNPVNGLDPDGCVVVVISGLAEHHNEGRPLADKIASGIIGEIGAGGLDGDRVVQVMMVMGGWGGPVGEATLRKEFESFVKRKKANPCSLEQFVAVGHSDGATAILHLLQDGTFNKKPTPAYLGFIDLVRVSYLAGGNTDASTSETIAKPDGTKVENFRQTYGEPWGWRGRVVSGADVNIDVNRDWGFYAVENGRATNKQVFLNHFTIFTEPGIQREIAKRPAWAYADRVMAEVRAHPDYKPWHRKAGEYW